MKFCFFFLFWATLAATSPLIAQVITISQARALPAGTVVTIQGVVTTNANLSSCRYVQDGTAAIAVYPAKGSIAGFGKNIKSGDSVEISGSLTVFKNLLEISPVTAFQVLAHGRPLPTPKKITIADIGPAYESQLVQLDNLQFTDRRDTIMENASLSVTDNSGYKSKVYIPKGSPYAGAALPKQPVQLLAVISRFDNYQILPLNLGDFAQEKTIELESAIVTSNLKVLNCKAGKVSIQDASGKEQLFAIVHSSGITQIDVSSLPAGAYNASVEAKGKKYNLPFQKK